jgi:nitrogen fixation protein NifX
MNAPTLPEDLALRIGLAARSLPDTDVARLLQVLADAVGLPPTAAALDALTVKSLKQAANGELAELDPDSLKQALAILKGQGSTTIEPAPEPQPFVASEMPGSIRVACASNGGEQLDGHFGSCRRFLIYQVAPDEIRLIECREIDPDRQAAAEDKNDYRAALIADCHVLYVASIGGPAAAKVIKREVHPIKRPQMGQARDHVAALSESLATKTPPWLAKIMGQGTDERVRFERTTEEA